MTCLVRLVKNGTRNIDKFLHEKVRICPPSPRPTDDNGGHEVDESDEGEGAEEDAVHLARAGSVALMDKNTFRYLFTLCVKGL